MTSDPPPRKCRQPERLRPEQRLRRQADFDQVYERGAHAADDVLVIRACANGLEWSRLGLAVSRKVGSAVLRNRWKRLVREAFRRQQGQLPVGLDLVVRPRRGATPQLEAVARSLERLCRRAAQRVERNS